MPPSADVGGGEEVLDMAEKPILFSGEMVRAILDGRKTQTRRVMRTQPTNPKYTGLNWVEAGNDNTIHFYLTNPYGRPSDLLWVRETHVIDWYPDGDIDAKGRPGSVHYRADNTIISRSWDGQWRPSIFMPRWASRITLEVTAVRVERLQDISEDDAVAEGVHTDMAINFESGDDSPIGLFGNLWDSINAKRGYGWDVNPFVWVVGFKLNK